MTPAGRIAEYKVGLVAALFLFGAGGLLIYVGIQRDLFANRVDYLLLTPTGESIERGLPVRLSGFNIGNVSDIDLQENGSIVITISILERYERWFRTDTRISLDREGFIGNAFLKVIPGQPDAEELLPGSTIIMSDPPRTIGDLVAQIEPSIKDFQDIVKDMRTFTNQIIDPSGPIQKSLINIYAVSDSLSDDQGLLHYLTADPEPAEKVKDLLVKLDSTVQNLDQISAMALTAGRNVTAGADEMLLFVRELRGSLEKLQPSIDNLNTVTTDVRDAASGLGRLRNEAENVLNESSDTLDRVQNTWPLRRAPAPPPRVPTP